MECRDAQFYLRLRRHAGDELGADTSTALDQHLAGCPTCAADARIALAFDRAVGVAMRAVPVPVGLREKLFNQVAAHRGGIIRRKMYQVAALAASLFLSAGLAFGLFSATRPKINTNDLVMSADEQFERPDKAIEKWLADQKFPAHLPLPFDETLLVSLGTEKVAGKDVPVAVFRPRGEERGFAKVYLFRTDGTYNLDNLRDAQASHTAVKVISDPRQFRGVNYVILYTGRDLQPFLRSGQAG